MDKSGIASSSGDREGGKWKWTKPKIIVFCVFAGFLLILLFTEVILFEPYESSTDEYEDFEEEEGQVDLYAIHDYSQIDSFDLNSLPPVAAGQTNTLPITGNEIITPSPTNNASTRPQVDNSDEYSEIQTTNEPQTSNKTTQLKVSDEGEIVEVLKEKEENTSSETSEQATNTTIEEQFYTPVTVTGIITSASDGTALSGVKITVKGTAISTVTDFGGKYAIAVPGNPLYRTLQFAYLGNLNERMVQPDTKVINLKF